MGIELMDSRCLSMIRTSINQCLSVHILQYGWLEALLLLFTWVIYIFGPWWLWFKYTWQESFSTYSENPVKRNNCQGSGCWIGKLWVILILLRLFGWQPSFATPCVAQPQLVAWKSSARVWRVLSLQELWLPKLARQPNDWQKLLGGHTCVGCEGCQPNSPNPCDIVAINPNITVTPMRNDEFLNFS